MDKEIIKEIQKLWDIKYEGLIKFVWYKDSVGWKAKNGSCSSYMKLDAKDMRKKDTFKVIEVVEKKLELDLMRFGLQSIKNK